MRPLAAELVKIRQYSTVLIQHIDNKVRFYYKKLEIPLLVTSFSPTHKIMDFTEYLFSTDVEYQMYQNHVWTVLQCVKE